MIRTAPLPVAMFLSLACLAACDSGTEPVTIDRVRVEPATFTLEMGETVPLQATPQAASGAAIVGQTVVWTSSNDAVATVSSTGLVTGVSAGPVTITASVGGRSGTASGEVEPDLTVAPEGGTFTSADGKVTLVVPPGAVSAPLKITIRPSAGLPSEPRMIPGSAYRFGPSGTQFAEPVLMTVRYGQVPAVLAEDVAYLWMHRLTNGAWAPLAGVVVDTVAGTITVPLTGFSDYAALISELAAEVRQLSNRFFVLVTSPTAELAVDVMALAAGLLAKSEHPLFTGLVDPVIDALRSTVCSTFTTALEVAQSTVVSDYQKLIDVLAPLHVWTRVAFEFTAPCDHSVQVDQIHTQKFVEFVDFYTGKLGQTDFGADFDRLVDEVAFVIKLRQDAQALALDALEARIKNEAYVPLLVELREAAYTACRTDGVHRHQGSLRETILLLDDVPFEEEDLIEDMQYCGTLIDWRLENTEEQAVGSGTLGGGPAPGSVTREGAAAGVKEGSLELSGDFRAFICEDGSTSDEMTVLLAGTEVHRSAPDADGHFLADPLNLDLATIFAEADVDPNETGPHRVEVVRESVGCGGAYVESPGAAMPLVWIDLDTATASCPAPPDWAVPSTWEEIDLDTQGGVGTYSMNVSPKQVSVSARSTSTVSGRSWFAVRVESAFTDYVKVVPVHRWPDDGQIDLYFRNVGSARAVRERAWTSGGLCYGDDVEVSAGSWYSWVQAYPGCGEMEGTSEIDEVKSIRFRESDDWIDFTTSASAYARVRGFTNTAEAEANLTVTFEGAKDSGGNPVPVLVCAASGTQY